ncbi:AAA family ATPase [Bdellovibrionota bacterium FG-1]
MDLFRRNLLNQLIHWKNKTTRLPLILWGARQVGKSTSVEAFGAEHFPKSHIFNFQKNASLKTAFQGDLQPSEILNALRISQKTEIGPHDLLFFDEIQECPEALTSLKYFSELLPRQPVIAAGSHLGLVKNEAAFPVGKVEFLSLHPMTYFEFLDNLEPETFDVISKQPFDSPTPIPEFFHQRALHWLRLYLCVGGMPEAVAAFARLRDPEAQGVLRAREVQRRLVQGYYGDFSKHSGTVNANHIVRVFDAAAIQLGRMQDASVKKFQFSDVIPKRKGFESIDGPLTWLEKSRLIIKTYMANRFEQPIKAFTQTNYFKAYLFDTGILNCMLDVPIENLFSESLGTYKGYLAENFVAQELFATLDRPLMGWTEGESEVEFVVSRGADLCPIEVKASSRTRRAKSLDSLIRKYHPPMSIKATGQNRSFAAQRKILTLPMYLVASICFSSDTKINH